ncbi:ribonucleotide-diphosphate reductase subunit beta [Parasphaerochaeta coccoides]|uniref:Ribonucleoside-diphosphate reductase subunit beta n=1 Tax=Parasphaerochaeta coccoides (strain ATCC BAA-1237 / DSM 17374 / SPN1) TaxID=760011 RepID=F4GLD1_PARC1|nr:ribonucleotide-diphosphate reductase subunit beta [Parasphaerochaeta coccoides]AEC02963.1 ribonucleotide reductase [Parasphaerochaeta coccoides DSM 17374]
MPVTGDKDKYNDDCFPIYRKPIFNEHGDTGLDKRRMVGGNTTNLNDFNNLKYGWTSDWYRQAMNNFWIPEEINMNTDVQDYRRLSPAEKTAYDKILSFLIFLDSVQTANLPNLAQFITANEVNLCLTIQAFQEAIHSQSYSYMLDTICSPDERTGILYQWRDDAHLLARNKFIGDLYQNFMVNQDVCQIVKTMVANYILEGIYFYSGFMFFYNLGRNNKMPGSVQEIRYINRDETTHLWLFRSILREMQKEEPAMFTPNLVDEYRAMIKQGADQEIAWGHYVIGDDIVGLNKDMVTDYIQYLGNLRCTDLGFQPIYEGHDKEPETMKWVGQYSNANLIKTDFFEARNTAYAKSTSLLDDL